MEYGLGAFPARPKRTDFYVGNLLPIKPVEAIPREWKPDTLFESQFQGGNPHCVAHTVEMVSTCDEYNERGYVTRMHPSFFYHNRLENQYQGEGMMVDEALANFNHLGILEKNKAAFIKGPFQITNAMRENAMLQRCASYARAYSEADIKTSMMMYGTKPHPVMMCIPVYSSFINCPADGMIPMPDTAREHFYGYHEIVGLYWIVDALGNTRWAIQNWWWSWGDQKMQKYSMAYLPTQYPFVDIHTTTNLKIPAALYNKIILWLNKNNAIVRGVEKLIDPNRPDVVPLVRDGRTIIPLRFLIENLGLKVHYDETDQHIEIDIDGALQTTISNLDFINVD